MPRRLERSFAPAVPVLAAVTVTLVLAAAFAPELPAAPGPLGPSRPLSGAASLLDRTPRVLQGLKLPQLQAELAAGGDRRKQAVQRLQRASAADAPTLHRWLHRKTRVAPVDYKNMLRHIGAQVPDRHGRFGRPARVKNLDWLQALLALDRAKLPRHLRDAYPDTLLNVALLRALAASRAPDASLSLLRFAYRHNSAFKDECGRQIRAMGFHAVPGLLRARALRDPLGFKMVRYAAYQLDRMDCARPERVLKQADPELRVVLLHAYGEVRDPAAVPAVLRRTNARILRVRRAARWAMLRYVSGRAPDAVKRKLKLPGGRKTERERVLYLTYRQLASRALVDRLADELHARRPSGPDAESLRRTLLRESDARDVAERLFTLLDRKRNRAREAALAAAFAKAKAGDLGPALEEFDRQLAEDPYHPRRAEMAPFYYKRGIVLTREGKSQQAVVLLTKSIHLAPDARFAPDARARRGDLETMAAATGNDGSGPDNASASSSPIPSRGQVALVLMIAAVVVLLLTLGLGILRQRLSL